MIATKDLAEELRATLRGKVLSHEPMVLHTSFKIGGPADLLVIPEDVKDLKAALAFARSKGLPSWVMGSGSNTLVRDGGIRGMVILPNAFQELTRVGNEVTAGAGVRVSRLLAFCSKQGLSGLEILSGVPGTVGGAVWGNAGAWGGSTSDHLARVQVVTDEGEELTREREAIPFRYRFSGLPKGSVIVQATFALAPGDPTAIRQLQLGRLDGIRGRHATLGNEVFRLRPLGDQLLDRVGRHGWVHHQDVGHLDKHGHRIEILYGVIGQFF